MNSENSLLGKLYKILSGQVRCVIDNDVYIYRHPTASVLAQSEQIYLDTVRLLKYDCLFQDDLILNMIKYDLWSPELEVEYKAYGKNVENLKVSLYEAYTQFKKRDEIRDRLEKLRKRFIELIKKRNIYDNCSIESIANDFKMNYIITQVIEPKINPEDNELANKLLFEIVNKSIPDHEIRQLSKLEEWKAMWYSSGACAYHVFGKPITELSGEQISLINWSRFYDRILENYESPPPEVIEDDDMLDGWVIVQARKRNKDNKEPDINTPGTEVFVMVENPDDVNRIESKNDLMSKLIKKQRENIIKRDGIVEEQNLPDAKQRINEQARMEQLRRMHSGK